MTNNNQMRFSPPLTYSHEYPAPAFLPHPVRYKPVGAPNHSAPIQTVATFYAARARYAFALIARAGLKPGNTVLVPAYHCPAMVEPFRWAGCSVVFYPMTRHLAPIPERLEALLPQADAVLFTRYFGFEQVTPDLFARAREHRCLVIEDLAHAAFATILHGDVGVTSLTKFLPQYHGADIWCADASLAKRLTEVIARQQFGMTRWVFAKLRRKVGRKLRRATGSDSSTRSRYRHFDETELARPTRLSSRAVSKRYPSAPEDCTQRHHYQRLLEIASRSEFGVPLYPELPSDVVPYMFPFLLHDAETFHHIRRARIPLYRWEELIPTDCEISADYRARLIQIPCHQDMRPEDFERIDTCLSRAPQATAISENQA